MTRFLAVTVLFHALLVAAGGCLARAHARRLRGSPTWPTRDLLLVSAAFAALAATAAFVAAGLVPPVNDFTALRFLAQAVFGELPLLLAVLGGLHALRGRRRQAVLATVLAATLIVVYWDAYWREPRALQATLHAVDLAPPAGGARHAALGLGDRPEAGGRLRLVHLSDIQTDRPGEHEARALRLAGALEPDLIVLTGDYVQRRRPTSESPGAATAALRALLRRVPLRAPLGVYAVGGDVDWYWPQPLEGMGLTCLDDSVARVELPGSRGLSIVGLSVSASHGRDPDAVARLVGGTPAADLRLVLGHSPDFVIELAGRARVDLALAGHTHGGQVRLPFVGPLLTKTRLPRRFAADVHEYRGIPVHVTRGVGLERGTAPQLRFLCPPEVCLLEIRY